VIDLVERSKVVTVIPKRELFHRVGSIVRRLRAVHNFCSVEFAREVAAIDAELAAIETELAKQVDDYMAGKLADHNTADVGYLDRNGLSGRWRQGRTKTA